MPIATCIPTCALQRRGRGFVGKDRSDEDLGTTPMRNAERAVLTFFIWKAMVACTEGGPAAYVAGGDDDDRQGNAANTATAFACRDDGGDTGAEGADDVS